MTGEPPILALDTNILVRGLVHDDPAQEEKAARLFRMADDGQVRLFVPVVVLCEMVWVLHSRYRFGRDEISGLLESLLQEAGLEFEGRESVASALASYRSGKGDFADYVIRQSAEGKGCEAVLTFEKKLLRERGFRAP